MKTRLSTPAVETCYLLDPMLRKDGYGEPWPLDAPWREIPVAQATNGARMILASCIHVPLMPVGVAPDALVEIPKGDVVLRHYVVVGPVADGLWWRRPSLHIFAGRCPTCKTVYWARP